MKSLIKTKKLIDICRPKKNKKPQQSLMEHQR